MGGLRQHRGGDEHSSSFSTLFSIASACLPNTARQTCAWIDRKAGKNRISRLGTREADSLRQVRSSRTRWPMRYPRVLSLPSPHERR